MPRFAPSILWEKTLQPKNYLGQNFGLLVVTSEAEKAGKHRRMNCVCACGNQKTVHLSNITRGLTTSCGCEQKRIVSTVNSTHRKTGTREYITWRNMRERCENPKNKGYQQYGGRGINVCERWKSFENFFEDMGASNGLTLDRVNVNGNYEPSNCRWATRKTQANNTRANRLVSIGDRQITLKEACESASLNYKTVHQRLRRGWAIEKALELPTETNP